MLADRARRGFRVHLELFARKLVLLVPAGIGVAPPVERDGVYVLGGRCLYPLRTREPTGVVEVASPRPLRLGDLFRHLGAAARAATAGRFHEARVRCSRS